MTSRARTLVSKHILRHIRRAAKREPIERTLLALEGHLPDLGASALGYLLPPPSEYSADEVRRARVDDLLMELHPSQYFQWHQYFQRPDAVKLALLRVAPHCRRFFDIGANVGFYGLLLSQRFPELETVLFEPHPTSLRRIHRHVALNGLERVRVVESAVSLRSGTAEIAEFGGDDLGKVSLRAESEQRARIQIPTISLDDAAQSWGTPDLVKIDVEGFEAEVLQGGPQVLSGHPVVCLEYSPEWYNSHQRDAIIRLLSSYECFSLDTVRHNKRTELRTHRVAISQLRAQTNVLCIPERWRAKLNVALTLR